MFTIFICIDFYVKDDYTKCMQYPPWYSYVKDEFTKWLRYVILHLLNHMSNMISLCPGWIYGKYAISNIILLCPGWIYEMFTIWIYTCLWLCPTWVSYVKDESTKWLLYVILHLFILTGCPTKKFTFCKSTYLRTLVSLRKSSVLEMNLWISSFKSTKSEFSRIFRFRAIKGIKHKLHISEYIWLTFELSEMSNYSKMVGIWSKIIIFYV